MQAGGMDFLHAARLLVCERYALMLIVERNGRWSLRRLPNPAAEAPDA